MSASSNAMDNRDEVCAQISAITHGNRRISADTGLRLSRFLGMSEGFWTGLQADYERELTKDRLGDKLDAIHPHAS